MHLDSTLFLFQPADSLLLKAGKTTTRAILMIEKENSNTFLWIPETFWTHILLPGLIPLLIIGVTITLNILLAKCELSKQLKHKQKFLFTWIDLIQSQIEEQAKEFTNLAPEVVDFEGQLLSFKVIPVHLDKVKFMDPPTLVSLFVINKKGNTLMKTNLLYKLENSIDYLKEKHKIGMDLIDQFIPVVENIDRIIEEYIQRLAQELRTAIKSAHGDIKITALSEKYETWQASEDISLRHFRNNHLEGLLNECQILIATDSGIGEPLYKARSLLRSIKKNFTTKKEKCETYSKIFSDKGAEINTKYLDLAQTKNALEKVPFKFFLWLK